MLLKSDIEEVYAKLSVADSIHKITFDDDESKAIWFANRIAKELQTLLRKYIHNEDFDDAIFKLELQAGLVACGKNKAIISTYGIRWFAQEGAMIEIFKIIEQIALEENI